MKLRGLYAITDSELLKGKLLPYVEAALKGGATLLQYRDKSSDDARRLREAEALRELCNRYGAALIINDDAELAARLGVGVHLGQTDGPLTPARTLLGRSAIIGATCHAQLDLAEGEDAVQRRAHGATDGWYEEAAAKMPMGKLGQPDEIADFIVFLLSERSGVVTGSIIDWDQNVIGAVD